MALESPVRDTGYNPSDYSGESNDKHEQSISSPRSQESPQHRSLASQPLALIIFSNITRPFVHPEGNMSVDATTTMCARWLFQRRCSATYTQRLRNFQKHDLDRHVCSRGRAVMCTFSYDGSRVTAALTILRH